MPVYNFLCPACGIEWEAYVSLQVSENPNCTCGTKPERVWALGTSHRAASGYPYITRNIRPDGQPVKVKSEAHLNQLCKEFGTTHRPDNGWIDKEYLGIDFRTGKQRYKEGSGMGMPGTWF